MAKKTSKTNVAIEEKVNSLPDNNDGKSLIDAERIIASKILCLASEQLIWQNNIPTNDPLVFVDFCYKVIGINIDNVVTAKLFYIKKKDGTRLDKVMTESGFVFKKGDEALFSINQLVMKKSRNGFTYWKAAQ